jgi:hypothetical protein
LVAVAVEPLEQQVLMAEPLHLLYRLLVGAEAEQKALAHLEALAEAEVWPYLIHSMQVGRGYLVRGIMVVLDGVQVLMATTKLVEAEAEKVQ